MAKTFEEILQEEMARPVHRSPQFWEAMTALGGTPEQVARHLSSASGPHVAAPESEVAGHMASARGRIPEDHFSRNESSIQDQVCRQLRSTWNMR